MEPVPLSDSLKSSFKAAQEQAASMAAPPVEWRRARRHRGIGGGAKAAVVVASIAAVAAMVGVASLHHESDDAASPSAVVAQSADATPPLEGPARSGTDAIELAFSNIPLQDAVRRLAAKTNARVHGFENLEAARATASLDWQGSDPAKAWAALLAGYPNAAASCNASSCDVWILKSQFALPPGMSSAPEGADPLAATAASGQGQPPGSTSSADTTDDGLPK